MDTHIYMMLKRVCDICIMQFMQNHDLVYIGQICIGCWSPAWTMRLIFHSLLIPFSTVPERFMLSMFLGQSFLEAIFIEIVSFLFFSFFPSILSLRILKSCLKM